MMNVYECYGNDPSQIGYPNMGKSRWIDDHHPIWKNVGQYGPCVTCDNLRNCGIPRVASREIWWIYGFSWESQRSKWEILQLAMLYYQRIPKGKHGHGAHVSSPQRDVSLSCPWTWTFLVPRFKGESCAKSWYFSPSRYLKAGNDWGNITYIHHVHPTKIGSFWLFHP